VEKILYVDLDGVLVDFIGGWMDHYSIVDRKPVTKWNFGEDYGLDRVDFYKSITSLPTSFWSNLKPTHWASELMDNLTSSLYGTDLNGKFAIINHRPTQDKIMFLSHAVSEDCRIGKHLWVNKHFPQFGDSLITVSDSRFKANFANENCTLIDDKLQNCRSFVEAGGRSYLFARPWNRGMPCDKDSIIFFPFSKLDDSHNQYTDIVYRNGYKERYLHYNSYEYEAVLEPVKIVKQTGLVEAITKGEL
jgi:hypothetical protein